MIQAGCQGRDRTPTIREKICPRCGHEVEVFSVDTEVICEHCGQKIFNDALSCVQWCEYARQCVGDEMYEALMEVAARNKERIRKEREEQKALKAAQAAQNPGGDIIRMRASA